MKRILTALFAILLTASLALAQAPPQTGVYTFQGQGNLPQIISSLGNPSPNAVPFGNTAGTYSLLVPFGDVTESLGDFLVIGAHYGTQVCSTSPCNVTAAVVECNATSGPITVQLPGAGGTGFFTWVLKTDGTANACNITRAGSDTINFSASAIAITNQAQSILLDDEVTGNWVAIAPPIAGSTGGMLSATLNFNNYSGINVNTIQLVQLAPPSGVTAGASCSSSCSTLYTYEVTCAGDASTETTPSLTVTTSNNATLSSSNFNTIGWNAESSCHGGFNVYGRIGGSLGKLGNTGGNSFVDNGSASVGAAPPSANSTGTILAPSVVLTNSNSADPAVVVNASTGQTGDLEDWNIGGTNYAVLNTLGFSLLQGLNFSVAGSSLLFGPVVAQAGTTVKGGQSQTGSLIVTAIGTPSAAAIVSGFTAGTTDYYYCVAQDKNAKDTIPSQSAIGTTGTTGTMACGGQTGALKYYLLRTASSTPPTGTGNYLVGSCTTTTGVACNVADAGNTLTSFTVQAFDQTANLTGYYTGNTTYYLRGSGAGNYTTTSSSPVAVDATNLEQAVTIPVGYKLLISAAGTGEAPSGEILIIGIADVTSGVVSLASDEIATSSQIPFAMNYVMNGDGNSHTIGLVFTSFSSGTSTVINSAAYLSPQMTLELIPSN